MNQLLATKSQDSAEKVGQVLFAKNDTRRRFSGSLSWYPINNQQDLFENDTIFSGDDSAAKVEISIDGKPMNLHLAENTMLKVSTSNGQSEINLEMGSISSNLAKGQSFKIKVGNSSTVIKASGSDSNLKITSSGKGKAKIIATKGEFQVTANGKTQNIKENKSADLEGNTIKLEGLKIKLVSPSINKPLIISNKKDIPFKWQVLSDKVNKPLVIEVAKDEDFKTMVLSTPEDSFVQADQIKKSGTYFWRLSSEDGKNQSPSKSFTIIKSDNFITNSPKNDTIKSIQKNEEGSVEFSWEKLPEINKYTIEVAKDDQFKNIIFSEDTIKPRLTKSLPEGLYYWRVKSTFKNSKKTILTQKINFAVGPAGSFAEYITMLRTKAAKPIINKQKSGKGIFSKSTLTLNNFNVWVKKIKPGTENKQQNKITIKWKKSLKNENVKVWLADNKLFKNSQQHITKKLNAIFNLQEPGKFYVKAQYLNNKKQLVPNPLSKINFTYKIKYDVRSPKLMQPYNGLKLISFGSSEISIYFEWQDLKYADKYILQISANKNFSRILQEEITNENSYYFNERLLQKQLYWRVKTIYKTTHSKWSKTRTIELSTSKKQK